MILSVFPAWFPADAALIGMLVFVLSVLAMNRSRMRMVRVVMQDEALLVGVGAAVAAGSGRLSELVGTGSQDAYIVLGVAVALLGVVMWGSG